MRRIEALTGPEATRLFEQRTAELRELASVLKAPEGDLVRAAERLGERVRELQSRPTGDDGATAADALVEAAEEIGGRARGHRARRWPDAKALLELSDRVRQKLGDAAVVLGAATDGRVHLVAQVAPALVERGLKAGEVIRTAAEVVGGGEGAGTRWPRPGGATPSGSTTRLLPRATRSSTRFHNLRASACARPWGGPLRLCRVRSVGHARDAARRWWSAPTPDGG